MKLLHEEGSVVDIDGNELWFHSTLVPVNDNDRLDYIIVISIDITDRKQAEGHLQQLNAELEKRVASRTLEIMEANKQLKKLSEIDPLTKIANRRVYEKRLVEEIAAAKRTLNPLALMMIDIDFFKDFNDHYGHDVGDQVLKRVAEAISKSLPRKTDLVARFGGEEFVVLVPATNIEGAYIVGEHIRKNVKALAIKHDYSSTADVLTVSVGLVSLQGDHLNEADILHFADSALYAAKDKGRNQCALYEDEL